MAGCGEHRRPLVTSPGLPSGTGQARRIVCTLASIVGALVSSVETELQLSHPLSHKALWLCAGHRSIRDTTGGSKSSLGIFAGNHPVRL